ncbi:MAG: M24 family metallopeptidase [Peptostreptococcaceae bacterium]
MNKFFEKRIENLYTELEKKGIEKALVGDPISVFYLTGVMIHPYERFIGFFADSNKKECVMILPGVDKGRMIEVGIDECIYSDSEGPTGSISTLLSNTKDIGVDMKYYSMEIGNILLKINSNIKDISDIVSNLRLYKDELEIEKIQQAAICADKALEEVKPLIKAGVSEKYITLKLYESMANMDGIITDEFVIQVLGGIRSSNPHGVSGDYVLKKGDSITIDFGGYYEHYWSDFCRTFFIEEVNTEMEKIYNIVLEANQKAIQHARPGICAKEVDLVARNYIESKGYGDLFIHRTGHGIGLNIHENPYIHSNNDEILKEGMIFTVEPGIYIPNLGGVRIEDDVLVTKDGYKILNKYPKDIESMILK